jgi:hypothetical protein
MAAKSLDLNSIEHLWDNFDQPVIRRPFTPWNIIQLKSPNWETNNIPQAEINTLLCFMHDARQRLTLKMSIPDIYLWFCQIDLFCISLPFSIFRINPQQYFFTKIVIKYTLIHINLLNPDFHVSFLYAEEVSFFVHYI